MAAVPYLRDRKRWAREGEGVGVGQGGGRGGDEECKETERAERERAGEKGRRTQRASERKRGE